MPHISTTGPAEGKPSGAARHSDFRKSNDPCASGAREHAISTERVDLLSRATGDAIWDWNAETGETWWSGSFFSNYGYAADTVPSLEAWLDHVHPDDREQALDEFRRASTQSEGAWSSEYRFRRADGSYAVVLDRVHCIGGRDGRTQRMLGSIVDISGLRRLESDVKLLAHAVESTSDMISITSLDDRLVFVNRAFLSTYGYDRDELIGRTPMLVRAEAQEPDALISWIRTRASDGGWSGELLNRRKDGSVFPIHLSASAVRDARGAVVALVGIANDISERKHTEERLRRDANILARLNDAVVCTDLRGVVTYWNDACERLLGWTAAEALGHSFLDLHPKHEHEDRWTRFERVIDGNTIDAEWESLRKDGRKVWISGHIERFIDSDGRPVGVITVGRDITQQKQAAAELQGSEERFRAMFEQAALGMAIVAFDGRLLRTNSRLASITGYSDAELARLTLRDLAHPDDFGRRVEDEARLAAGDLPVLTEETRLCRADGTSVWVELTRSLARRADGAPDHYIAIVQDITQRRELEARVRQTQKMEAIGLLAGGVAHDFNNVLTVIGGHAALVASDPTLSPGARESFDEIVRAAQKAGGLTRQLLVFGRREQVNLRQLDLNECVAQFTRMIRRLIGENIALDFRQNAAPLPVCADAVMIDQVLMNLAVNARDAMPHGGTLVIETTVRRIEAEEAEVRGVSPGLFACVSVGDTGCGMAPDILPHIFEPFYTTKEAGKGTGLGLATVFSIVKQHRGFVKVNSIPGYGSVFDVLLPLGSLGRERPSDPVPASPSVRHGGRVLLVEDDVAVRAITGAALTRSGYHVVAAGDANQALRLWADAQGHFDLLVTDLMLPGGLAGTDLAARLQSESPALRVLMMSGYNFRDAGQPPETNERQLFLAKPFKIEDLLSALARLSHAARHGEA